MTDDAAHRLAAIVEASDDAIVSKTLDGVVQTWNPAAERIFGYSRAEMVGAPITRLFPPDRLAEEAEFLARLRRGERIEHFETIRRTKDGRLIDVSVSLSPIRDAAGRITGAAKIARDITLQRRAAAAADAQRRLLAVTLSSIGDGVLTTDPEGRVTFLNPVAETLTGWSAADAAGQPVLAVFRIVDERSREPVDNPVLRALRDGRTVGLANHTVLIDRNGRERPIDDTAAPIHDEQGRLAGGVLVFRDISARRRREHDLLRLAAIIQWSDDAILSKDLRGTITSWNPGAERMFGHTAAEAVGRSITLIIPADRLAEEAEVLAAIRRGEAVDHYETVRVRKDGTRLDVSVTVSPMKGSDGAIVGASKIARDITSRKQADAERAALLAREQVARAEAEAANRAKDQFLAVLSHELRTPLNAVCGWARMLQSGQLDKEAAARGLEVILRNADAQLQLIDELLDVSRVIMGKMRLDVRVVDLKQVVGDALDTVRPALAAKGIRVEQMLDPRAESVSGDPGRLQQVIWNLLINAVKFTPKGGRIQILLRRVNSSVEIVVSDTGDGIAPEALPFIFDRFRHTDRAGAHAPQGGLGLGLALVRHLVELHGGSVVARSAGIGQGATFIVRLPVPITQAGPAAGSHPTAPSPLAGTAAPGPLEGIRVLVVDDDHDALHLASVVLANAGATVRSALSAGEGLALLRRWRPDVLIFDIEMPGVDGYELIRQVRALPAEEGGRTPAVALTAHGRVEDRMRTLAAGFSMHVPKPVDPGELTTIVASLAGRA